MHLRASRAALLVVGIALAVAACRPITPDAPPPADPGAAAPPACVDVAAPAPNPEAPVDYVAAVEPAGPDDFAVETFTAASTEQCDKSVAALDAKGDILALGVEHTYTTQVTPGDDPRFPEQYGLQPAHADFTTAWTNGYDGTGVVVAVVDTGVQADHPDLVGRVDLLNGEDFINPPASATGTVDPNSHGTHVAGIVAAADNTQGIVGGAPGATILPIRVLNASGSGSTSTVAQGIDWARTHGADIVNLSLGGPSPQDTVLQTAVHNATVAGVVVVAAAGNCGAGGSNCPTANIPNYPAAGPDADVIAVGATDQSTGRASYSNFNRRTADDWPHALRYVDLAAPGTAVLSTIPTPVPGGYGNKSGTSMATPHAAAAVALLIDRCGFAKNAARAAKVEQMLVTTARGGTELGAGLIRVGAATAASLPCP